MTTPIAVAVEPLRASAVQRAAEYAEEYIAGVMANLARNGWDLNQAFPSPRIGMDRFAYAVASMQRANASRLTSWTKVSLRHGEPCIVVRSDKGCAKFVQDAKDDADASYTAFIAKLEAKVGEHQRATLEGNHVWGYSVLTALTADGEQRWKTQQIVNISKLGKVFNQWPTRLVK
jgi:hypothetical protein